MYWRRITSPLPSIDPNWKVRNPWGAMGLSIITLGIYFAYRNYSCSSSLKNFQKRGRGGWLAIAFAIIFPIVVFFKSSTESAAITRFRLVAARDLRYWILESCPLVGTSIGFTGMKPL